MDNQTQLQTELVSIYKLLHRMPEIGLQEHKTTAYIRQYISKIDGVEQVQPKMETDLKTGLIAVIRSQPVLTQPKANGYLFRCQIDALCFKEESGLDYKSQNGLHHACGHDAHTAMMLIAMKMIAKNKSKLKRNIYFCFQPGEEGHGGAAKLVQKYRHVIAKIEHAFAMHIGNYRVPPMIIIPTQYATANSNTFTVEVIGHSAHCMMPYAAIDANYIGCQIVNQIYNCRTRLTEPSTGMAIAVSKIQGGTDNVARISQKLLIKGSIRSYQQKYHQKVLKYIENYASSLCEVNGASCKFEVNKSFYRAVKNQKSAIDIVSKSAASIFQKIQFRGPSFAGEDFCEFSQKVPSCYFNLAVGLPDTIDSMTGESKFPVHNSKFKLDENSLWKGSLLWAKIAQN